MRLPFTLDQFLDVMRQYNLGVWPLQVSLLALGLTAVGLAFRGGPRTSGAVGGILAVLWLWTGIGYHLAWFAEINGAALLFGAAFVLQAALFAWASGTGRLVFDATGRRWPGMLLVVYAFIAYPALSVLLGHRYPAAPTFGMPCPTTIATLGVLLWARAPVPPWLYAVPLLWAAVGTSAALQLGMLEDLGLTAAAAVVIVVALTRRVAMR